ncbi:molybdate ABC transporter substrate-binding protein [Corynebacterium sp. LK2510]|uniref:molybdate ABC transporter substrate-binding protein n=1 Tax=Corynebacterium sp. LK2510 TaxID=3110472 RepID=UPI0034CEF945
MRLSRVLTPLAALTAATLLSSCAAEDDAELLVLGASSVRVVNDDIQTLSPVPLSFVNAGSSELVSQLIDGSPGDLLITADRKTMDAAVSAGVAENPEVLAQNTIVLVVPAGNPAGVTSLEDLSRDDVRTVVCDVQVPCGAATQQILAANAVTMTPVSMENNVAGTLGKVVSGDADAGFVYRTDAIAAGEQVETIDIAHAEDFPTTVIGAVVADSARATQARALLGTLAGDDSAEMWKRHGFAPASS